MIFGTPWYGTKKISISQEIMQRVDPINCWSPEICRKSPVQSCFSLCSKRPETRKESTKCGGYKWFYDELSSTRTLKRHHISQVSPQPAPSWHPNNWWRNFSFIRFIPFVGHYVLPVLEKISVLKTISGIWFRRKPRFSRKKAWIRENVGSALSILENSFW